MRTPKSLTCWRCRGAGWCLRRRVSPGANPSLCRNAQHWVGSHRASSNDHRQTHPRQPAVGPSRPAATQQQQADAAVSRPCRGRYSSEFVSSDPIQAKRDPIREKKQQPPNRPPNSETRGRFPAMSRPVLQSNGQTHTHTDNGTVSTPGTLVEQGQRAVGTTPNSQVAYLHAWSGCRPVSPPLRLACWRCSAVLQKCATLGRFPPRERQ